MTSINAYTLPHVRFSLSEELFGLFAKQTSQISLPVWDPILANEMGCLNGNLAH